MPKQFDNPHYGQPNKIFPSHIQSVTVDDDKAVFVAPEFPLPVLLNEARINNDAQGTSTTVSKADLGKAIAGIVRDDNTGPGESAWLLNTVAIGTGVIVPGFEGRRRLLRRDRPSGDVQKS